MAYNGFAIDNYLDAAEVTKQLDELIKKPIYSVMPDALKKYEEEYYDAKCSKSKALQDEAKKFIPVGKSFAPNMDNHEKYEGYYQSFLKLYGANKKVYKQLYAAGGKHE